MYNRGQSRLQHALSLLPVSVPAMSGDLKHLHSVDTHLDCPQTFLGLGFQCRDDISELK